MPTAHAQVPMQNISDSETGSSPTSSYDMKAGISTEPHDPTKWKQLIAEESEKWNICVKSNIPTHNVQRSTASRDLQSDSSTGSEYRYREPQHSGPKRPTDHGSNKSMRKSHQLVTPPEAKTRRKVTPNQIQTQIDEPREPEPCRKKHEGCSKGAGTSACEKRQHDQSENSP